jgi:hypothetical protein
MDPKVANSRRQLYVVMYLGGVLGLIFGAIHLSSFLATDSAISLSDAGINSLIGVLELIAGRLVAKGKFLSILCILAILLASLLYSCGVGRGLNFYSIAFGGMFLLWIILLRRQGGLS